MLFTYFDVRILTFQLNVALHLGFLQNVLLVICLIMSVLFPVGFEISQTSPIVGCLFLMFFWDGIRAGVVCYVGMLTN